MNLNLTEIGSIRGSTKKLITLSKEDIRFVDKRLNRIQEQMEQLLRDLPFIN